MHSPRPPRLSLRTAARAVALAALLAGAAGALAQDDAPAPDPVEAVVVLKDGSRLTGLLISRTDAEIVLKIGGLAVTTPADEVESVNVLQPVLVRYRELRALIDDADVGRLLVLAEWLRGNGLLDEALAELDHVLRVDPNSGQAAALRDLVRQQIALRDATRSPSGGEPVIEDRSGGRDSHSLRARAVQDEFPLLTEEQVNLVRAFEVDLDDPPRLVISRDTIDRLFARYGSDPLLPQTEIGRDEFRSLPPKDVLEVMFRLQARDLYGEVRMTEPPAPLAMFRDDVNRGWLAVGCASNACHGGPDAGDLVLYNRRPAADEAFLTNLLIIERFRLADGSALIDYQSPERSPLLQLGLPPAQSATPHPEVRGWRPIFRSRESKRFGATVDWIRSMHQPRTEWPLDWPPPGSDWPGRLPARKPATESDGAGGGQPPPGP